MARGRDIDESTQWPIDDDDPTYWPGGVENPATSPGVTPPPTPGAGGGSTPPPGGGHIDGIGDTIAPGSSIARATRRLYRIGAGAGRSAGLARCLHRPQSERLQPDHRGVLQRRQLRGLANP